MFDSFFHLFGPTTKKSFAHLVFNMVENNNKRYKTNGNMEENNNTRYKTNGDSNDDKVWKKDTRLLQMYIAENYATWDGFIPMKCKVEGFDLAKWANEQRRLGIEKTLSLDKSKQLKKAGLNLNTNWENNFEDLSKFALENGGTHWREKSSL